jgi:hypothetical protein
MITARIFVLTVIVFFELAHSASAFDNQRKGFVLSLGGGVTPAARWSYEPTDGLSETEPGIAWQSLVGWGISPKDILGFQGVASWNRSDIAADGVVHTFFGLTWHHYMSSEARSPFCVLGVGSYLLGMSIRSGDLRDKYGLQAEGFGAQVGGGMEFANHWQLAGHVSGGLAEQKYFTESSEYRLEGERFRAFRVALLLSYVAY